VKRYSLGYHPDEPGSLRAIAKLDLAEALDMSNVSESRKHFYVYSFLLLLTLFFDTMKNFSDSDVGRGRLNAEVVRMIATGAVAKDLYK
jgi:hypothetical protein